MGRCPVAQCLAHSRKRTLKVVHWYLQDPGMPVISDGLTNHSICFGQGCWAVTASCDAQTVFLSEKGKHLPGVQLWILYQQLLSKFTIHIGKPTSQKKLQLFSVQFCLTIVRILIPLSIYKSWVLIALAEWLSSIVSKYYLQIIFKWVIFDK